MNGKENIIPEASNLYSALRNSGYSNTAAVSDLIDNSLDAGAKKIKIDIADDLSQIYISDDGTGMSLETLNQALKLGGRRAHNTATDLGKYGLGMITASTSMGTKLRVITRKDGVTSVGLFDVDEACKLNKFVASFRKANDSENQSFDFRTDNAEHGTVLIIDNCDKIQYTNAEDFREALKSHLKTAFWSFIADGVTILINDKPVPSEDPLFRFDKRTEVLVDKTVAVPMNDGTTEELQILAVLLPDFDAKLKKSMRINIETQGFYVLRNNREIAPAVEIIEVFKKHNDFNRLRIKLNFGPGLDDEMGVNYTKHNISPNTRMIGVLRHELENKIKAVRKAILKEVKKEKEKKKAALSKNVFVQPAPVVQPSTATTTAATSAVTSAEIATVPEVVSTPVKDVIKEVNVKTRFKTEKDGLIELTISDENASVWYNGANEFYQKVIVEQDNGSELKKHLDVVLKSLLESLVKNDVSSDVMNDVVEDISSALGESEF